MKNRIARLMMSFFALVFLLAAIPAFSVGDAAAPPAPAASDARQKAAIEAGFPEYLQWPDDLNPNDFFPVSRVRPGMRGKGRTVFQGTRTEEFDFEILGVEHGALSGFDIIWARLEHPRLEGLGVVAGMSGSPLFIDGKLLGAVAYGYRFLKDPVAGITPAEQMLRVLNATDHKPHPRESGATASNWPEARAIMQRWNRERSFRMGAGEARRLGIPGADEFPSEGALMEPLATPLMVSSGSPRVIELASRFFTPLGFSVAAGGAAGGGAGGMGGGKPGRLVSRNLEIYGERPPIENGSAIGVLLMQGDCNIGAIGTATYVHGDRLMAFGHPMMGEGEVDIPMTSAVIQGIMPTIMFPFKIGEMFEEIGSVRQDRRAAIGASLRYRTPLMPMRVRLELPEMRETREFNYEIWPHRFYGPYMAIIAWMDAIEANDRSSGPVTLESKLDIHLAGGRVISRRDFYSGDSTPVLMAGYPLLDQLGTLFNNPFAPVKVERIEMQGRLRQRTDLAILINAELDRPSYRPGETARIRLWVQQWQGGISELSIPFEVPRDLDDGSYSLQINDGSSRERMEYQRRPYLNQPMTLDQLIDRFQVAYPTNALYLTLMRPTQGLAVGDQPMPDLPGSVFGAMSQSARAHTTMPIQTVLIREIHKEFPYEIGGGRSLTLNVDHLRID